MLLAFRRLFVIYKGYRFRLIVSQVLLFVSALCMIAIATQTQKLIDDGIIAQNPDVIIDTGIWMLVLAVVSAVAMAGTAALAVFFAQGTAYYLRTRIYEQVQTFSFSNFDHFRTGNLMVRLNADVNNVMNAVTYAVLLFMLAPFMVTIAFILTAVNIPSLVWLLVVVVGLVLAVMAFILPKIVRAYDERQERLDEVNNTLQENLAGVRVVKAFVREELEMARFATRADNMRKPAFEAAFRVALLSPLLAGITQLSIAVGIWVGGSQIINRTGLEVGELVAFMQYLNMVIMPLAIMSIVVPFLLRGDTSLRRIFEVIDAEPTVVDRPDAQPLTPAEVQGRIEFENVTFAFRRPDGELDPPALKNLSFTVEAGERVGILGATGAGKSALVNLIPRFYDVTEGRITIDGVDVRDIPQDNLRQIVGAALQEALLFQGDVRFNLKFGAPDVDDGIMQDAARTADAFGFIDNLPGQWSAPVARRGYNFSGGQRQRLSITRTLTARPRILILDDSTSALDVATESRVQGAIPDFSDNVTTIYVAQRISAVLDLDKIILMQYGEIVDMGNHEELLARSSLYQEIYASQLGGGITAGLEVEA